MLIRITNACRMNCSHCMINSTPDGKHMSAQTYIKCLEFVMKFDPTMIFLSGGEPTEHPQFLDFVSIAKTYIESKKIITLLVASNGMFLNNEDYSDEILKSNVTFQITNDSRYYPQRIKFVNNENLNYVNNLLLVSPFGRALTNNILCTRQSPLCFNLRSLIHYFDNFKTAIMYLRFKMAKMCVPSINIDGSIVVGECNSCYKIGDVDSTDQELVSNIKSMKCGKCNLYKNLTGKAQQSWESWEK